MLGSIIGGVLGLLGGSQQNSAAASQSQAQMDFQERMSGTSYQRAVKDLQAAGLSPMLAYSNGGASTPAGAQAPVQNTMTSAAQTSAATAQIENVQADTENKKANSALIAAQTAKTETEIPSIIQNTAKSAKETENITQQTANLRQEISRILSDDKLKQNQAVSESARASLYEAQQQLANMQKHVAAGTITLQEAQKDYQQILTRIQSLASSEGEARSEYWQSDMGKKQPYAEGVEKMGDAAGSVLGGIFKKVVPNRKPK